MYQLARRRMSVFLFACLSTMGVATYMTDTSATLMPRRLSSMLSASVSE